MEEVALCRWKAKGIAMVVPDKIDIEFKKGSLHNDKKIDSTRKNKIVTISASIAGAPNYTEQARPAPKRQVDCNAARIGKSTRKDQC